MPPTIKQSHILVTHKLPLAEVPGPIQEFQVLGGARHSVYPTFDLALAGAKVWCSRHHRSCLVAVVVPWNDAPEGVWPWHRVIVSIVRYEA